MGCYYEDLKEMVEGRYSSKVKYANCKNGGGEHCDTCKYWIGEPAGG